MAQIDLSRLIADHVAATTFDRLPPSAVEGAKKSIIDTLGVTLAASGMEPAVRGLIEFVQESGGRPESSILAFGGKVPAMMAALANGAMCHCLDFDDQTPWGQHSASSIIPPVFAISERLGGVTGRQMITAVAIGQDLFMRMRQHIDWRKDWMFSTVMGVFCGTAASCHLLGVSRDKVANALGIALMQSCGSAEVVNSTGSDLRAMYAGFSSKGAVLAALLAERGIPGVPRAFEGPFGLMNLYFGGRYDREAILDGLGSDYTGGQTLYKRWPAVGTSHSHVHATIQLMTEHDLAADDIVELRVHVGDYHQLMCDPIDQRRRPATLVDAKFSLPYLVAVAALRRDLGLASFTAAALRDPVVLALAEKVVPVPDASLDWKMEMPPGKVEIVTRDGRTLARVGMAIPGSVENPMTWDDVLRKFDDCAAASIKPLSAHAIEGAHRMARGLELLPDATELLRL